MKKIFTICIAIVFHFAGNTQAENWNFEDPVEAFCSDGVTEIFTFSDWHAYQTVDNTWNGEEDTTICINLQENGSTNFQLPYADIDVSRPVFLKCIEEDFLLEPNSVYFFHWRCDDMDELDFYDVNYCDGFLCDGLRLGITVPASDTSFTTRLYHQEFFKCSAIPNCQPEMGGCSIEFFTCLPTEGFVDGNYLSDVVFQMNFNEDLDLSDGFEISSIHLGQIGDWCTNQITSDNISNYSSSTNTYNFYWSWNGCDIDNWWNLDNPEGCTASDAFLMLWQGVGFPSEENKYYLDLYPETNLTAQQTIFVNVDANVSLQFQPFTYLRGGLVAGEDTLRHLLQYNNEGEFCLSEYVDLVIGEQERYEHHVGSKVSLQSGRSCMQLSGGGEMVIKENANLMYGHTGQGIFATYGSAKIFLEENAGFFINNHIIIAAHAGQPVLPVEIFAAPGSRIVFGDLCWLDNRTLDKGVKWIIHSDGAYIDLTALDAEERQSIVVLYDVAPQNVAVLNVFGNPVNELLSFSLHSATETDAQLRISDNKGKLVWEKKISLLPGYNLINESMKQFATGSYLVSISDGNALATFRLMVR